MRTTSPSALAALATATALLVSGCGSSNNAASDTPTTPAATSASSSATTASAPSGDFASMTPQQIQDAAKAATIGATSLHLSGSVTTNGVPESLDLQLDNQGNCKGTLGIGDKGSAELLGTGGTYWFKPDEAFWRAYAGASADKIIAAVGNKYVVNPDLSNVCDLKAFFDNSSKDTKPPQNLGTETVDGQDTVKIGTTDAKGSTVGYVLLSDPHYVVKLERTGPEAGAFTLTDFGATLDVQAPSASDQITLSQLGG